MRQTLGRTIRAAGLLLAASLLTTAALAQTGDEGLSPTLANIKQTHVARLGYRESSPPFSFLDQANRPIGYSLELCEAIVDEIGVEVDDANLKIEYVKVTSDDRIPAWGQKQIDRECVTARHRARGRFRVPGKYLSYEPYGIMFRKGEPQLAAVVERTFRKLGSNRDLIPLYNKWFVSRLPTGEKLNVAISPQLEDAFKVLDDTVGANN